jgi:allantoinase
VTSVVRGGLVVTPTGVRAADIVIEDGRITEMAGSGCGEGATLLDAGGLLVLPGMVDAHVHFDEPGRADWEGFDTGSAAAAAGGVTTVVDMPIDCDPPTVTAAAVRAKVAAAEAASRVDVALWGGLVPASVDEVEGMVAEGVVGFKAFACPSGWEEFPAADAETLAAGARAAGHLGLPVAVHCELAGLGHGVDSEVAAIAWAAGHVTGAGARLHVVHVSSAEGVDEAHRWPRVTVETCPHYLTLDPSIGPTANCWPPIRGRAAREELWRRVTDGLVDAIASDHSPCPPALRQADPPWAGIDGVGLPLPVLLSAGRLTVERIAGLTTAAARILGLPGKGALAPGFDADLAVVDPAGRWTPGPATLWSRHRASPYAGTPLTGQVVATVVRGRVVYTLDTGPGPAGGGVFVRPR